MHIVPRNGKYVQPLDATDASDRKEVLPLKNLDSGDCTGYTFQVLLVLVINAVKMTFLTTTQIGAVQGNTLRHTPN